MKKLEIKLSKIYKSSIENEERLKQYLEKRYFTRVSLNHRPSTKHS